MMRFKRILCLLGLCVLVIVVGVVVHELTHVVLILLEPHATPRGFYLFTKELLLDGSLGRVTFEGYCILPVWLHELIAYLVSLIVMLSIVKKSKLGRDS